jgi:hypothetical protein
VKLTARQLPLSLGRLKNGYLFLSKITRNRIPVPRCAFGAFLISKAVSAEVFGGKRRKEGSYMTTPMRTETTVMTS